MIQHRWGGNSEEGLIFLHRPQPLSIHGKRNCQAMRRSTRGDGRGSVRQPTSTTTIRYADALTRGNPVTLLDSERRLRDDWRALSNVCKNAAGACPPPTTPRALRRYLVYVTPPSYMPSHLASWPMSAVIVIADATSVTHAAE